MRRHRTFKQLRRELKWTGIRLVTRVSGAWARVKPYVRRKRFSLGILIVALVITPFVVLFAGDLYTYRRSQTLISFVPWDDQIEAREATIVINHVGNGKDTVWIWLSFVGEAKDPEKNGFTLVMSENLNPPESQGNAHIEKTHSIRDRKTKEILHFYKLDGSGFYRLDETFVGDVFGSHGSEIGLSFYVSWVGKGNMPTRVIIEGLDNVNLDMVYPEPIVRYPNRLIYEFNGITDAKNGGIFLTGVDRRIMNTNEFKLFTLGVVLGGLLSVIAQIVIDVVAYFEDRQSA